MTEVYVGQVMMTGFPFAPRTFAQCNGQLLSIQQNQALFSLLGVTYGGNGTTNFQLPDLRSRTPVGALHNYPMGLVAGVENVTLLVPNLPMHNHVFAATTAAGATTTPANSLYGAALKADGTTPLPLYTAPSGNPIPLNPSELGQTGGNAPHANIQPCQAINFNIALSGVYPSRN